MKNFLLIFSFALTLSAFAQDKSKQFDSLFSAPMGANLFNGNVLIAENGKVIFQKSYGTRDFSNKLPLNSETIFELASVSKQFTAMGIMLLNKNGKIKYDDSLRKFFPQLPYPGVTVRHLLQHTGGLPDYMNLFDSLWPSTKIAVNDDLIRLFAEHKPTRLFAPGEKWEYSNTGYAILAAIIEKVSGKTFGAYMNEQVFKPLGMTRTLVYRRRLEKRALPNYAYGYSWNKTSNKAILPDSSADVAKMVYTLDGIQGDGIINSTTTDLFKWDRSLYTEQLIPKSMLAEAFAPAKLNSDSTYGYGFGWGISTLPVFGKRLSHTGGWPGYSTLIERFPDHQHAIIILQNVEGPRPAIKNVRNILFGIKDTAVSLTVDSAKLRDYLGVYELAPSFSITITADSQLYAQATGQSKFRLYAEKPDLYFLKEVEAKIQFVRGTDGKVNNIILLQNGQEVPGKKIK